MEPSSIILFLLSGRSGSGKSTMAYEVCHQLSSPSFDVPHIHIEGDGLDFIHPPKAEQDTPNMMLTNLRSVFGNYYRYRRGSCGIVLISGTGMVLRWEEIREVVEEASRQVDEKDDGVPRIEVHVNGIVLCASDTTVEARLRQREIGTDLQRHLDSSRRMAGILDKQFGDGADAPFPVARFVTDQGSVGDIAAGIVRHMLQVFETRAQGELS